MILPNKYVSFSESYIGMSAYILDIIGRKEMKFEEIYSKFLKKYTKSKIFTTLPTVEKFSLCLSFMYMSRMINYNERGGIYNENIRDEDSQ